MAETRASDTGASGTRASGTRASGTDASAATLGRVRALLAKAESTTFPDEAEALTAKAQELMARYAIDVAMIERDDAGGVGAPVSRAVDIHRPYARERFLLLAAVAEANRCQAVWARHVEQGIVVGFATDAEAVEVLYTSLLVQATSAMLAAGTTPDTRARRFRTSFLLGYAGRIAVRLREAQTVATDEAAADHGDDLLPVLASRQAAVTRAVAEAFPEGRTEVTEWVDDDGHGNGPFAIRFALVREGDRFILDTTASDDQAPGPINYLTHPNVLNMIFGLYFLAEHLA